MYVVPLKWFPWLLLIGGVVWLCSGEADSGIAIVPILIGGAWLVIKYLNKKTNTTDNTEAAAPSSVQTAAVPSGTKKCPRCGAEMKAEQIFCSNCGSRLN